MPWNLVFVSLIRMDPQNLAVLWSDSGRQQLSILNIFAGDWHHIRACQPEPLPFRFGACLLPSYNQTLSIAAAEQVAGQQMPPDEAMLVLEDCLVFGGVTDDQALT